MSEYKQVQIDDKTFDEFVKNHPNKEFTQLSAWAYVKSDYWYSRKVAMEKDGELIATALLLFRKMPVLNYTLCYSPRGFVMDYSNKDDVRAMISIVKECAKKEKAFTIKIDPNIDRYKYPGLVEFLEGEGFKHNGFTKGLVDAQPRFTFVVNLEADEDEIFSRFTGKSRNHIRKAMKNGLFFEEAGADKLPLFWKFMQETGSRDGIQIRYYEYYERLMESYSKSNDIRMFLVGLNAKDAKANAEKELTTIEKENAKFEKKLEKTKEEQKKENIYLEIKKLNVRKEKALDQIKVMDGFLNGGEEKVYLSSGIMVTCGDAAYYLYGGATSELRELMPSYMMVYNMMLAAKKSGIKYYDLGGISGYTEEDGEVNDDASGLYGFKKQFGGEMLERIGEFDCTLKPAISKMFNIAMSIRNR